MFSYRHAFHAGNHADVLKHAVLVHMLDYFNRKDAPYWVVDTHAGAGLYALDSEWATKNAEFTDGISRLWDRTDLPPIFAEYLEQIRRYNTDGVLRHYPGSPWLALDALRDRDRIRMFEMHPKEQEILASNLAKIEGLNRRQTAIYPEDGFEGLKALLPPPTRRGMVLIDPSYEDKQDYRRTFNAVKEGLKRFATGTFAVWYPLVQRREATDMVRSLENLEVKNWLNVSLTVKKPATEGFGLHGSGMFIVNPPWTLHAELKDAMPVLTKLLAQDDRATHTLNHRTD